MVELVLLEGRREPSTYYSPLSSSSILSGVCDLYLYVSKAAGVVWGAAIRLLEGEDKDEDEGG